MSKKASVALAIGALGLIMSGGVSLARDAMTLHVEVTSDGDEGENVKMAMPLDLVAAMAGSLTTSESVTAELFDEFSKEGFDLRKFWQQVKEGNINEFFNLEVKEAKVRAWRSDGMFRITVDASESDEEIAGRTGAQVEVTIPEDLMDILVEADGKVEPEDLVAALRAMGAMTLVKVETDKESVHVWLD